MRLNNKRKRSVEQMSSNISILLHLDWNSLSDLSIFILFESPEEPWAFDEE